MIVKLKNQSKRKSHCCIEWLAYTASRIFDYCDHLTKLDTTQCETVFGNARAMEQTCDDAILAYNNRGL
jgi:hypothetical protein